MKRKALSILLTVATVATMLVGCGDTTTNNDTPTSTTPAESTHAASTDAESTDADVAADEGKVLNIYCWNEEFKSRVTDHYPGYEEVDATHGKIGDVDVVWTIVANADNAYQNNLDATLLNQADAAADDKIDIFLVEADYALKYVDSDYTMPVADLGITDADLANQYQYTKDIVTDSNGVLRVFHGRDVPALYSTTEKQLRIS